MSVHPRFSIGPFFSWRFRGSPW